MNATRATINQIVILDQKTGGKGGFASLISGGVGFNHSGIHLKSQRNQGIDFIIDIYGV